MFGDGVSFPLTKFWALYLPCSLTFSVFSLCLADKNKMSTDIFKSLLHHSLLLFMTDVVSPFTAVKAAEFGYVFWAVSSCQRFIVM